MAEGVRKLFLSSSIYHIFYVYFNFSSTDLFLVNSLIFVFVFCRHFTPFLKISGRTRHWLSLSIVEPRLKSRQNRRSLRSERPTRLMSFWRNFL